MSKTPNTEHVDAITKAFTRTAPNSLGTWAIDLAAFVEAPDHGLADRARASESPIDFLVGYARNLRDRAVITTAFLGLYPEAETRSGRAAIGRIHRAASTIIDNVPGIEQTAQFMEQDTIDAMVEAIQRDTVGTAEALAELAAIADGYDAERGIPDPPAPMMAEQSTYAEAVERIRTASKATPAEYVTFQKAADAVRQSKPTITGWVSRHPDRFKRDDRRRLLLSDVLAFDRERVHKSAIQDREAFEGDIEPDATTTKHIEHAKVSAARSKRGR